MSNQFYTSHKYSDFDAAEAEVRKLEEEHGLRAPADAPEEGKPETVQKPLADDAIGAEEQTFKERYGNLRRHAQHQETLYKDQISNLQRQIDDLGRQQMAVPQNAAEVEQWIKDYPDIARIVETIASRKALEARADLDKRFEEVEQDRRAVNRQKAETALMQKHPDLLELRNSDDFHQWVQDPENPDWVRDSLYHNEHDYKSASRAIDLYKADKGISTKKRKSSADDARDAAASIRTGSSSREVKPEGRTFTESQINKMRPGEFERLWPEIQKAQKEGRIVLDLSGGAR